MNNEPKRAAPGELSAASAARSGLAFRPVNLDCSFPRRIDSYRERVEATLDHWLPDRSEAPTSLHEAMRYSVLGGGKRIRPLLIYATGEALGVPARTLDGPAAALELIHAFSLVHDDLPAMDDDALRRGRPTAHKAFGEATAILAGDALQPLAFEILASDPLLTGNPTAQTALINTLAKAAGSLGMTGGQAIDLASEGQHLSVDELEQMYLYKTGDLIRASILMPCHLCPDLSAEDLGRFDKFAKRVGLAFQIRDDILDIEGETEVIGKTQGADNVRNKATYPALFGIGEAKSRVAVLYQEAMSSLDAFKGDATSLRWLSDYMVKRDH